MKNILMAAASIALLIAASSVAYYFVIVLPHEQSQSQTDISAIRAAIAPTAQEQATGSSHSEGHGAAACKNQRVRKVHHGHGRKKQRLHQPAMSKRSEQHHGLLEMR